MSNQPRPLVPAPSGYVRGGQDVGQAYQAEARNKKENGPKARAACTPCRGRKTKCDAQRPVCGACSLRDSECNYDIPPDTTRYTSLKRKHQDLERENSQLLELYQMLKHRPESDADSILQRIRNSNDIVSILSFIRDGDLLVQARTTATAPTATVPVTNTLPRLNSPTETLLNTWHTNAYPTLPHVDDIGAGLGQKRKSVVDIDGGGSPTLPGHESDNARSLSKPHALCDERLHRVNATRWTTVTDDNTIVANLISLYLSWEHTIFRLFDEDYFLDQLAEGKTDYCSSLLVNALLAIATLNYKSIDPHETVGLSERFFEEARRLWREEEGHTELLHVPVAVLLNTWCNYKSKDRLGSLFLVQGVQIAKDLRLFRRLQRQDDETDDESPHTHRGRAIIAWGIFNWQAVDGFLTQSESHFSRPPTAPIPYDPDETDDETWHSFPLFRPQQAKQSRLTFRTMSELCIPLNEHLVRCENLPNPQDKDSGFENARLLHNSLLHWADRLPTEMCRSAECLPPVLSMHMLYHAIVIEAFRPFTAPKFSPAPIHSQTTPSPSSIACQIMEASLAQLRRLFYIQQYRYGGPPQPGMLAGPIQVLTSALLDDMLEAQQASAQLQSQQSDFQRPGPSTYAAALRRQPTASSSSIASTAPTPPSSLSRTESSLTSASSTTNLPSGPNAPSSSTFFSSPTDEGKTETEKYLILTTSLLDTYGYSYEIFHVLLHALLSNPRFASLTLPPRVQRLRKELSEKLFRRASIAEIQERYPVAGKLGATDPTGTAVEELTRAAREISLGQSVGHAKQREEWLGGGEGLQSGPQADRMGGGRASQRAVEEGLIALRGKEGHGKGKGKAVGGRGSADSNEGEEGTETEERGELGREYKRRRSSASK